MRAIKITPENQEAIEAALRAVNGRAEAHTYYAYSQLEDIAEQAEKKILGWLPKKSAPGAQYCKTSGYDVARAYKNARIGTRVTLIRKTAGWYLADVRAVTLYEAGGGPGRMLLTPGQSAEALARFSAQWGLLP